MAGKVPNIEPASSGPRLRPILRQYWSPKFGKWITKRYPRKSLTVTEARYYFIQRFISAAAVIKQFSGEDRINAAALAANTPFLDRDILMKAASGNLITMIDTNNRTWMGIMDANSQIQTLLDSISNLPGVILVRTTAGWLALEPPSDIDQFLGFDTALGYPQWMDGGGGGGADPDYKITTLADFPTTIGTGTVSDTPHGISMDQAGSTRAITGAVQSIGSVDATFIFRAQSNNMWFNYNSAGIMMRDSASGKILAATITAQNGGGGSTSNFQVTRWNSASSYNTTDGGAIPIGQSDGWFKVVYHHTTSTFDIYCSQDGENWRTIVTGESWLAAADQIGPCVFAFDNSAHAQGTAPYFLKVI